MISLLEQITLNLVSFTWILVHWFSYGFGISSIQDVVTVLVGLSIVFFNAARGIKALRKRKENDPKG